MIPRIINIIFLLFTSCLALYENCDYYQKMEPGKIYYVYSPGYPENYLPESSCRWYAVAPVGTQIILNVETLLIPPSMDCAFDRLSVSKTGRVDMLDAVNYCGKGSVSVRSTENVMSIIFRAGPMSPGGKFLGSIRVDPEQTEDCLCGWTNQKRIVGGVNTGVNEFPMMAGLKYIGDREIYCGATIISPMYAVTAAHCLIGKSNRQIVLVVGDHDLSTNNETYSTRQHHIDKMIVHANYDQKTHVNDIGLVKVLTAISFHLKVGPACLPFKEMQSPLTGEKVTALGWGSMRFGGETSNTLKKVRLSVVGNAQCVATYQAPLSPNQMCAYEKDKDSCQSDSGGPLLWMDPETGFLKLVGIVSYGIQCGIYPSVNTRVGGYVKWITTVTGEKFCIK